MSPGAVPSDPKSRLAELEACLVSLESVLVAYSGGVDSTFLAAAAYRALGDRALAVTVDLAAVPERMIQDACRVAAQIGIAHEVLSCDQLSFPGVCENSAQRCYHCKRAILQRLVAMAEQHGIAAVIEGSNADDLNDYRPGRAAVTEAGVKSPLLEQGWTKQQIREASRLLGLPTADMPAYACLASRIPYGEKITAHKLRQVDAVEAVLERHGLMPARARHHSDTVRIELADVAHLKACLEPDIRSAVVARAKEVGFRYVTVDLEPYRSGRLNDALASREPTATTASSKEAIPDDTRGTR